MTDVVRLQQEPIRPGRLIDAVGGEENGAVDLFLGVVRRTHRERRVLRLEYTAYPEMAEAEMERIVARARRRFEISSVALVHRTGLLEIGEISVAVAVSAPHRGAAFEACRWVIDEVKRSVPIWKRETFEGGAVWIEGAGETPAESR